MTETEKPAEQPTVSPDSPPARPPERNPTTEVKSADKITHRESPAHKPKE